MSGSAEQEIGEIAAGGRAREGEGPPRILLGEQVELLPPEIDDEARCCAGCASTCP